MSTASDLGAVAKLKAILLVPFAAELSAWASKNGIDHIHCHFCADGAHVALFAYLLGGPTYSISLHGALSANGGNQLNKWRHASFGIAVTQTLLGEAKAELGDSAPANWGVAPMGVDTSVFRREAPYVPYQAHGPLRIFSCGRLDPGKGHDVLLRAVAVLQQRGLDARLRIAGNDDTPKGEYRRFLERLSSSLGIEERVTFLGATSEDSVREELGQAHLFALASLGEAIGVATMEAMAMGVPAVATRVGGVPELIESGETGLLVEPGNPEGLADALETIARHPTLALALSAAGERRVRGSFDTFRSARALFEFVERRAAGTLEQPALEFGTGQ